MVGCDIAEAYQRKAFGLGVLFCPTTSTISGTLSETLVERKILYALHL